MHHGTAMSGHQGYGWAVGMEDENGRHTAVGCSIVLNAEYLGKSGDGIWCSCEGARIWGLQGLDWRTGGGWAS